MEARNFVFQRIGCVSVHVCKSSLAWLTRYIMDDSLAYTSLALSPLRVKVPLVEYQCTETSSFLSDLEPPSGDVNFPVGSCSQSTMSWSPSKCSSHFMHHLSVIDIPLSRNLGLSRWDATAIRLSDVSKIFNSSKVQLSSSCLPAKMSSCRSREILAKFSSLLFPSSIASFG